MLRPTVTTAQLESDPALLQTLQYSIAKSILTSYSGDFDWLAEGVQNSVDALQRRWEQVSSGFLNRSRRVRFARCFPTTPYPV